MRPGDEWLNLKRDVFLKWSFFTNKSGSRDMTIKSENMKNSNTKKLLGISSANILSFHSCISDLNRKASQKLYTQDDQWFWTIKCPWFFQNFSDQIWQNSLIFFENRLIDHVGIIEYLRVIFWRKVWFHRIVFS